jgi:putative DNA primase/helicase
VEQDIAPSGATQVPSPQTTTDRLERTGVAAPAVLAAALEARECGLSALAIRAIGEPWFEYDERTGDRHRRIDRRTGELADYGPKIPIGRWKLYQTCQASPAYLRRCLTHPEWGAKRGLCIVSGFGDIDALDFDDLPTWEAFRMRATGDAELAGILERIAAGYFELSPRGAPHFLYRCCDLSSGGHLARRPVIVTGDDGAKDFKVLVETRGPGQIIVVAPTPGTCHPTGRPYTLQRGGFATIATITPDERRKLFNLAREFDEVPPDTEPEPESTTNAAHEPGTATAGEHPGAHFSRVCTVDMWRDMLRTWGWEYIGLVSGRPHCWVHAKATSSLSAHLNKSGNLLVFSTSTPLAAYSKSNPSTHSPFFVYAAVSHRGDLAAAARTLVTRGYGSRPARPTRKRTQAAGWKQRAGFCRRKAGA